MRQPSLFLDLGTGSNYAGLQHHNARLIDHTILKMSTIKKWPRFYGHPVDCTYLMSASLLVMGMGIGAFGNSSRWTSAVNVTLGSQHLSLQKDHPTLSAV